MTVVIRPEQKSSPSVTRQSHSFLSDLNRLRSKTISTTSATFESENSSQQSTSFNLLQSIKDLTHQELNRANPLGLLGKEVISATGTTHCPEPIPPKESDELPINNQRSPISSLSHSSISETEQPQQIHFPLNDEEKLQMQRHRSILINPADVTLPPCPAEFMPLNDEQEIQPHLFSQPSPATMVADFIPDTMTINVFEVFIYAWGVFAFFFDMVTDLVLAHAYYQEGAYWLFILTLMCVLLPNLTLSVFSLVWYIDSSQLKAAANSQEKSDCELSYQTTFCQTEDLIEEDKNNQDQTDAPISRIRTVPQPPEKSVQSKRFRLSSTTADIITWIIRIIILVLQLDLCLK